MVEDFSDAQKGAEEKLRGRDEKASFPSDLFNREQKKEFDTVLSDLRGLYDAVAYIHDRNKKYGLSSEAHSLEHDLAVAMFAHAIGRRHSPAIARNSVAAALVHSYDRFLASPLEHSEKFTGSDVKQWVDQYLPLLSSTEKEEILLAATHHDRPNKGRKTDRPTVADVLADADKLASLMLYSIIRFGQINPRKPAMRIGYLDKLTPGATYHDYPVAFDNVQFVKQWLDDKSWFVTPEAIRTAEALEGPFKSFVELSRKQFEDLGLTSVPFSES